MDFNSCADKDGFRKSSHILCNDQILDMNILVIGIAKLPYWYGSKY